MPDSQVQMARPAQGRFARFFGKFMYFPGIGGNFVPLIQAIKIIIRKSSGDVSLVAFSFALFCLVCWLIYGVIQRDKVLIAANIIGVINMTVLLVSIVVYNQGPLLLWEQ